MAVNTSSEEGRILRQLVPLASFPTDAFAELCASITVEQVENKPIFTKGDTNTDLVYLLNGSVSLQADGLVVDVIYSDSDSAKFALAHQVPRKIDAVANGVARIVRLDAETINNPPQVDYHDHGFKLVEDFDQDSDDWMAALLRLPLFQNLSPINLQKILISLKTAHYSEGEVIVRENSPVEHFYLVSKGQCLMTRKLAHEDEAVQLKLGAGESFGEEYLITETPSRESVTAAGDVSLILLDKKHFLANIKTPMVGFIGQENVAEALQNGSILLDVRRPVSFEKQNLVGSANIPLLDLRQRIPEIPKDKQIIVVCGRGVESEAAAFILAKHNIKALVLQGGLGIVESQEEAQDSGFIGADEKETRSADETHANSQPEMGRDASEESLESLKAENARLTQYNHKLEAKVGQLQAEKDQAENRAQVLTQQLERLKGILNRLTKSK